MKTQTRSKELFVFVMGVCLTVIGIVQGVMLIIG